MRKISMQRQEGISVNVVILPDEATRKKAIRLGSILRENFETFYTIADENYKPHATIYQAQYPEKNYGKIKQKLSKLAESMAPLKLEINPYEIHADTYIWWNISRSKELDDFHHNVLEALNPLREEMILPFIKPDASAYVAGGNLTEEEAANVKNYGAVVVGRLFQPHITLGKLKNPSNEESLYKILPAEKSGFEVSEICIGKMGDYGTVTEILERFPLKNDYRNLF